MASYLDSIPKSWSKNFNQRSKGDPRGFVNDDRTKTALWASEDVYNNNTNTSFGDWTQVASRPFQPSGSGRIVAALGGGDLRLKVYKNSKNEIMVSFIGTKNLTGVWQDAQLFKPIRADYVVPGAQGELHSGFAAVYQAAKPEIKKVLDQYPNAQVIFTGHSLGGAIASIASSDQWTGHQVSAITAGAPQIGDEIFSKWYQSSPDRRQDRIVQKSDPITIGNLGYVHADDAAWVVGDSNKWMDFKSHGIAAYRSASDQVNSQLHDNSNDFIYPQAKNFVTVVDLAKDAKRAYEYYKAAEEFYQVTQVASGLPLTAETFRNVVLTQDGVLARSFETTIDKLSQFQTPTRADFTNIFIDRVGEIKDQISAVAQTGQLVAKGLDKFVDVTNLTTSGLADIAPDVLRPISNADVLYKTANTDLLATEGTTLLKPVQNALDETAKTASNYFKLITESDTLSAARQALTSTAAQVGQAARPFTSAITNVYQATEGTRNWIAKAVPKATAVGGFLLNGLSFGTGIADIAHGDKSAETIASTTFAGIGTAVAGVEAAVAVGAVSSSILTASVGSLTIPVIGEIAAVAGLLTFGISWLVNKSKQKSQGQLEGEAIYDTLKHIGDQAIHAGVDIGIGNAPDGGDAFYHQHVDQVEYKDGKIVMKDGGSLIDLVYPPILLADGSKIHADDPNAYQQGRTAEEAYQKLQQAGIATGTQIQFVSDNYKDFRYQTSSEAAGTSAKSVAQLAIEAGNKAAGRAAPKVPTEAPDVSILFQGKPFQDHFLPIMTYKGETILPSQNPKLYAQVQTANSIYDALQKFDLGDKTAFIDKYASEFQATPDGQIQINGQDFKDAIFQPIEGISYSQNPGAYENMALTKYLYDGLVEKGLSTGGLSQTEFLNNYFAHINLDDQGNIKIDGVDAADYHYDPITDLNGNVFYRFQDPTQYDKVQAFYNVYDKLNDDYKGITGRLLNPKDLWNELSPTMQILSGNQMAFGMTPDEMQHPQNQLYLLHQAEQRAIDLGMPIDQKKLSQLYQTVENASFNNTTGNGFTLSPRGDVLYNGSPIINNLVATYFFNGKMYDYNQSPKEYINALQYKSQEKYNVGAIPKSLIDVIVQTTLSNTKLPNDNLSSYSGYLTKAIGPVSFTLPTPQVVAHELGQMQDAPRQAYEQYQADVARETEAIRTQRQQDFTGAASPMEQPEPTLRAADKIYEQMVLMGIPMQMDKNQFSQLYASHITFDQNGAILINGKSSVPLPQPLEYQGQQIYQVSDPQLYNQVQAANTVFQELQQRGQMNAKDKDQFINQYKDQLSVSPTGDISFQGKTIGSQAQTQPLDLNANLGLSRAVIDKQPTPTLPNPFENNPVRPTPHAGVVPNQDDVALPTQLPEQQSLMNPLQNTESKIQGINSSLSVSEAPNTTLAQSTMQDFYAAQEYNVPGSIGFVPNGQKLPASLQNHLWVITFENGQQDTYPRQRMLQGYTMQGNWTGSTPLANGGPVNVLDSYMLAFHIQRKHNTGLATKFLLQRLQKAIQMKTIAVHIDLREFEIAQQILSADSRNEADIFSMEALDHQASWNIGARLQVKMQEVLDQRNTPAALPEKLDLSKALNIPKLQPTENPLKRSIEAAGILGDSLVQNKLRRVYSEYESYIDFSKSYMHQLDQVQGGTIVPSMQRTLLEGIIAKDEIVQDVVDEWMFLLNQPVSWLFQNV